MEQTCQEIGGLVIECKEGDSELCLLCNEEPEQDLEDQGYVVWEGGVGDQMGNRVLDFEVY